MLNTASGNGSIARRSPWELRDDSFSQKKSAAEIPPYLWYSLNEIAASLLLPERRQVPQAEGAAPNPKGRREDLLCPNQASVGESRDDLFELPTIHARNVTHSNTLLNKHS